MCIKSIKSTFTEMGIRDACIARDLHIMKYYTFELTGMNRKLNSGDSYFFTDSALNLLITGKIIKSQMHSKLYICLRVTYV